VVSKEQQDTTQRGQTAHTSNIRFVARQSHRHPQPHGPPIYVAALMSAPKRQTQSPNLSRSLSAAWQARGYRPETADTKPSTADDDEYGEAAYQRAFAEAAKHNPPRVPNPHHYPNSWSAQEYIRKRDQALDSTVTTRRFRPNPCYVPPVIDIHRAAREGKDPAQGPSQSISNPALPPIPYIAPPPATTSDRPPFMDTSTVSNRPMLLEPKIDAPSGPVYKLRSFID